MTDTSDMPPGAGGEDRGTRIAEYVLGTLVGDARAAFEAELARDESLRSAVLKELPDDESALAQRAEALALWCHGFLAGLVVGGVDLAGDPSALPAEIDELVRDFAEISRAGLSEDEAAGKDQPDFALAELHEYVRVSAQIVFEELRGEPREPSRNVH